jgi:two-component system OmpR family sensor kinase
VARLNQGIDRAIRGVEQLLLLAREEAGSGPAGRVDLRQVIQLAVADVLPQARHKHIDLGLAGNSCAPDMAAANGQLDALRTLLRNLLENAVKYTPTGGQVDVSLGENQGQLVLTVQDSGPGIAPENHSRVFDRFFRASDTAQESGSGLGLAIVKAIADRHGAVLALGQSERLGGLKVEVRFAPATPG